MLAAAGCGGGKTPPKLDRADAAPLIALAHRIAYENECAQARDIPRFHRRVITLVNAGRVPTEFQEPLTSATNALLELEPSCIPGVGPYKPGPAYVLATNEVRPVPHAESTSQQAHNLESWLDWYSRAD